MSYNSATGAYTAAAGAETAAAGQVLQSATWDAIFADLRVALTFVGQGKFAGQTPLPSVVGLYASPPLQQVNFGASASDIGTFAINLPVSVSFYRVTGLTIYNASASLSGAQISLYTTAGATGTAVIGSTAITVTATAVNAANAVQYIQPSVSTLMLNVAQLFIHVSTSAAAAGMANCMLEIKPLF
jgi:hypothetical protein